mmetsp:Transcript_34776/g.90735  ORF Transcript_34776/g.90735 Transcript_34776/m.90735 type:complete len:204 (-) Transcript_34776:617-1228(-)
MKKLMDCTTAASIINPRVANITHRNGCMSGTRVTDEWITSTTHTTQSTTKWVATSMTWCMASSSQYTLRAMFMLATASSQQYVFRKKTPRMLNPRSWAATESRPIKLLRKDTAEAFRDSRTSAALRWTFTRKPSWECRGARSTATSRLTSAVFSWLSSPRPKSSDRHMSIIPRLPSTNRIDPTKNVESSMASLVSFSWMKRSA